MGLFGGTRYIPIWDHARSAATGIEWNLFILQAAAILEAVFTAFMLCRRPGAGKGQIGSASVCTLAALMVGIACVLDPHSVFVPGLTLILLNLVGIVSAVMSIVVRGLGL